jgi:multidrug efflux pump
VFAGMLAASSMGIFLVPMLYVTFQKLSERVKKRVDGEKSHAPVIPPTRNV